MAIKFSTTISKFGEQGEKTGWTYILISSKNAKLLKPGCKKSFRVSGKLDENLIEKIALMPMGDGTFIMPLNTEIRKKIRKSKGDHIVVEISEDIELPKPPSDFIEALKDEPDAFEFYQTLNFSHQNYFSNWIKSAKTTPTKVKRMAQAITAFTRKQSFPEMIKSFRKEKE
jgi:hypothetical protein